MHYPEGQVEHPEGTYEWSMENAETIAVRGNPLLINQVEYEGIVSLKRDGVENQFVFVWNESYFVRLGNVSTEPTMAARIIFRDRVLEIAHEADTDQLRHETQIAALEEEQNKAVGAVLRLKEEIEEFEDRIDEIDAELVGLRGV